MQITPSRYGNNISIKVDPLRNNIVWLIAHVPPARMSNSSGFKRKANDLTELEAKVLCLFLLFTVIVFSNVGVVLSLF